MSERQLIQYLQSKLPATEVAEAISCLTTGKITAPAHSQPRWQSWLEASCNTASGFAIAFLVGLVVYPLFGFPVTVSQNFWLVVIFTVVSVLRNYIWRRLFNALHRNPQAAARPTAPRSTADL